ncbi:MAG: fimbrial protein [Alistipes sp.]
MRNLILAASAALTLLCSCSKENNEVFEPATGSVINISFTDDAPQTRAFFGTTASAETWEKTLNSVTVFVFNPAGGLIVQRAFSTAELTAKKASFPLPNVTAGSSCDFYAVANLSTSGITNKSALLALLETTASQYNGTFAEVSTGAKRASGFVMSGYSTQAIATAGSTTNVALTLKRTVAKVAIEASLSSSFNATYPGSVRINSVSIKKAASQSPVIKPTIANSGSMNFSHTQISNVASGKYQNLFYLFENGNLSAGSRVTATIRATYDVDGNFSTTTDQTDMEYDAELTGDAAGAIMRNGYYRIAVTINGLSGNSATMTLAVADWESPITQNVSIGS